MKTKNELPTTLVGAIRYFADPDKCLSFVAGLRWPAGPTCPRCGAVEPLFLKTRRLWKCRACKKQFSVKVGTIFEDSPIGLDKWLPALWMVVNCKNGVSSYEIARALGVTQKTAWFMTHRIRLAMQTRTFKKMKGEVEVDETFIGGLARYMHKDKRRKKIKGPGVIGKAAVMGLLERHGPDEHSVVTLKHVPTIQKKALIPKYGRRSLRARGSTPMPCTPTRDWKPTSSTRSSTTPNPTPRAGSTLTDWKTSGRC
jgi:transposase-like protein